jgi:hypothetical protein
MQSSSRALSNSTTLARVAEQLPPPHGLLREPAVPLALGPLEEILNWALFYWRGMH